MFPWKKTLIIIWFMLFFIGFGIDIVGAFILGILAAMSLDILIEDFRRIK